MNNPYPKKACPICAHVTYQDYCPECAKVHIQAKTLTKLDLKMKLSQPTAGKGLLEKALAALEGERVGA